MEEKIKRTLLFTLGILAVIVADIWIIEGMYLLLENLFPSIETIHSNIIYSGIATVEVLFFGGIYQKLYRGRGKTGSPQLANPISSLVVAFGAGGMALIWLILASDYLYEIPLIAKSLEIMNGAFDEMDSGLYLWSFLNVCLIGPMAEELMFRGLILNFLRKIWNRPWFFIGLSGILFGIWHGIFVQSVYTSLIGMVLGVVYYKTGKLRWPILIHVINNFLSTLPPVLQYDGVYLAIDNLSLLLILPTLYLLFQEEIQKKRIREKDRKEPSSDL